MKIRSLTSSLLFVGIAGVAPAVRADTPQPAAAPAMAPVATTTTATAPSPDEKTDLEKQMDRIGHAAKALKKQIADSTQNQASLKLVATIRDAAVASLNLTPAKAADLSGADRDKFIADYQAGMKQFIGAVDSLAGALKAGDNPSAIKDFQRLFSLEKQDHKQFRKPENH